MKDCNIFLFTTYIVKTFMDYFLNQMTLVITKLDFYDINLFFINLK